MATTRVEMSRTYTYGYTFEIPTHVAEEIGKKEMWINRPHGKDYWELYWDDQKEDCMRIEGVDIYQIYSDFDGAEFTVIDEVAELKQAVEEWKERYMALMKKEAKRNIDELRVAEESESRK